MDGLKAVPFTADFHQLVWATGLAHQPPYEKAFVGPAQEPYLAFKPSSLPLQFSGWFLLPCSLSTAPAQTPGQSHLRRGSCAPWVSALVIVNRGLNLEYVKRS
jgi:hypothetical protein